MKMEPCIKGPVHPPFTVKDGHSYVALVLAWKWAGDLA